MKRRADGQGAAGDPLQSRFPAASPRNYILTWPGKYSRLKFLWDGKRVSRDSPECSGKFRGWNMHVVPKANPEKMIDLMKSAITGRLAV